MAVWMGFVNAMSNLICFWFIRFIKIGLFWNWYGLAVIVSYLIEACADFWNCFFQKKAYNGIMYSRILELSGKHSAFLFGPRGTGKTTWLKESFKNAFYLDLLDTELYRELLLYPDHLEQLIPPDFDDWIILDEIQKVPALLNEVHRLIEGKKLRFILTGSSARKLRKKGVNLLAGRAHTEFFYPLTARELGKDFDLAHALRYGFLPSIYSKRFDKNEAESYLKSYIFTYLKEEIQEEALTRNLSAFGRFLEAASLSQGSILNVSQVAREAGVERKTVENYFTILEDLRFSYRLPAFTKRAKRKRLSHDKFYFFDAGVFHTLRPKGMLDTGEEIEGAGLETVFLQEAKALNDYLKLGYEINYWRNDSQMEVDFVFYGEHKLLAFEVKHARVLSPRDLRGLKSFKKEYPSAKLILLYGGDRKRYENGIEIIPFKDALLHLTDLLQ